MQAGGLLCGRGAALVYLQGAVIGALLAVGWAWAGYVRLCELRRQRLLASQHAAAAVQQPSAGGKPGARAPAALGWPGRGGCAGSGDEERPGFAGPNPGKDWPGVSVVLPVKGCRAHSGRNWRSQLGQRYAGPLEFIFVVDDAADPAVAAVQALLRPEGQGSGCGANTRVVTAPHATRCSQKIANLQVGLACCAQRAAEPHGTGLGISACRQRARCSGLEHNILHLLIGLLFMQCLECWAAESWNTSQAGAIRAWRCCSR